MKKTDRVPVLPTAKDIAQMTSAISANVKPLPPSCLSPLRPSVLPFLKWPGGKRWLLPTLLELASFREINRYREPFVGGGALFFALRPKHAVLSDVNRDLINTYRQVKYHAKEIIEELKCLQVDQKHYDHFRSSRPDTALQRAVRFLYLNRTAFGGMYRLNQAGQFNVPFGGGGRTAKPLWEANLLKLGGRALRFADLRAEDFQRSLDEAVAGDFVYCDPTYTVTHNNNGFVRYNEHNFSWADQKRLAEACRAAASRGAMVVVSNAHHDEVLKLFDPPQYLSVSRISRLCPNTEHRKRTDELVLVFPPLFRS